MPEARETGAAAGQLRPSVHLGWVAAKDAALEGRLEYLPLPWLGVHAASSVQLTQSGTAPQPVTVLAGFSLHLFPYRLFDLSLGFEAGPALLDPLSGHASLVPLFAPRAALSVYLNPHAFLELSGELAWMSNVKASGWLGFGFTP